jgi:hypothetical protein
VSQEGLNYVSECWGTVRLRVRFVASNFVRFVLNIRFGLLAQLFRRLVRNNKVPCSFLIKLLI